MLNIATPRLSPAEWRDVRTALTAVADCGCSTRQSAMVPTRMRPLRDFLCESGRARKISEPHVPALTAQGFSRAQIEAMALLGA